MNEKIQNDELNKVTGGAKSPTTCSRCGYTSSSSHFIVDTKRDGCHKTVTYKCPSCNHTWKI